MLVLKKSMRSTAWAPLFVLGMLDGLRAEPKPGDIFREYHFKPPGTDVFWRNNQNSLEVFGSLSQDPEAKLYGRATSTIQISDIQGATKLEVRTAIWSGHVGTDKRTFSLNGNTPITLASPSIPTSAGTGGKHSDYLYFYHPTFEIPVSQLKQGANTFQFDAFGGGSALFRHWGVTFRVYYGADKPHVKGSLVSPGANAGLGDEAPFGVTLKDPPAKVASVDYIGNYEDFNYQGDGVYQGWQWRSLFGELKSHVGHIVEAPAAAGAGGLRFAHTWNTRWIPDQNQPMRFVAHITDSSGITYVTPEVGGITLSRGAKGESVRFWKGTGIPKSYNPRVGGTTKTNQVNIEGDFTKATEALMFISTWNGKRAEGILVNGKTIAPNVADSIGFNEYSVDELKVSLTNLKAGNNALGVYCTNNKHGVDVLWPGMELKVRYTGLVPVHIITVKRSKMQLKSTESNLPQGMGWQFNGRRFDAKPQAKTFGSPRLIEIR